MMLIDDDELSYPHLRITTQHKPIYSSEDAKYAMTLDSIYQRFCTICRNHDVSLWILGLKLIYFHALKTNFEMIFGFI